MREHEELSIEVDFELLNIFNKLEDSEGENFRKDILSKIVDTISDNGEGRLSLSEENLKSLLEIKERGEYLLEDCRLIITELQAFGGNSVLNFFRQNKYVSYREIVRDVASYLKVDYLNDMTSCEIENRILAKILEESWNNISEPERAELLEALDLNKKLPIGAGGLALGQIYINAVGFEAYKGAAIIANALSKALLGKGLAFGANQILMKAIKVFTGPIGWAIAGIWGVYNVSGPAFRVTLPCVVYIATLRKRLELKACFKCGYELSLEMNYCAQCGEKV